VGNLEQKNTPAYLMQGVKQNPRTSGTGGNHLYYSKIFELMNKSRELLGNKKPPHIRYGGANKYIIAQNDYQCQLNFNDFEELFSEERLGKFLDFTKNKEHALELYETDSKLSASLCEVLNYFEVGLRNNIDKSMSKIYGDWLKRTDLFDQYAVNIMEKNSKLSDYTFGFWQHIFGTGPHGSYDKMIWKPAIFNGLQHCKLSERKHIHKSLRHIRELRNRIAHQEPIVFGVRFGKENITLSVTDIVNDLLYVADKIDDRLVAILLELIGENND
jgi:hypothetical protein